MNKKNIDIAVVAVNFEGTHLDSESPQHYTDERFHETKANLGVKKIFRKRMTKKMFLEREDYKKSYRLIQRLHGLQRRGIQTLVMQMPYAKMVRHPSKWEQAICIGIFRFEWHPEKYVSRATMHQKYIHFLKHRLTYLYQHVKFDHSLVCESGQNGCVSVTNHIRVAVGIPSDARNNIFIVGDSTVVGYWSMDEDTCATYLQRLVNEAVNKKNLANTYACVIYGLGGAKLDDSQVRLRNMVVRLGDVVVVGAEYRLFEMHPFRESCKENGVPLLFPQQIFDRPHWRGEVFYDRFHLNPNGNRGLGVFLYDKIFVNPVRLSVPAFFRHYFSGFSGFPLLWEAKEMGKPKPLSVAEKELSAHRDLAPFIKQLELLRTGSQTVGCIVMNCNPFTLGHLHLVETAVVHTDRLHVFVLEEDASAFLFVERFQLAHTGTAHLPSVQTLASSRFIISTVTLPEYFAKGEHPDAVVDASVDLEMFCRWVAPALAVSVRFAGEEPNDRVTLQYNNAMAERLPVCGVQVRIVPRKKDADGILPISASHVRTHLLSDKGTIFRFRPVSSIVPETTLDYLLQKYIT